MDLVLLARRWLHRLDREHLQSFARFLWTRFLDDHCFEAAGALSYTTMFALVPLSMVVFGVLSAFPVFDAWTDRVTDFVFSNFVPSSARVVEEYLRGFAASAEQLTLPGVIALLVSLLVAMWSIESTFNQIWRVPSPRPQLLRFLMYWTLLTLGSLLAVAVFAVSSYLFALPALAGSDSVGFGQRLLATTPTLVELATFTLAYMLIPHRTVPLRFALVGGLLATVLFESAKWAFAAYLRNVPTYQQIYETLSVVPIFLLWLYLSWVVLLLGASVAASLSSFRYQPKALQLPPGMELYGYLRLLGRFEEARRVGQALHMSQIQQREPSLTDDLLQRMIAGLTSLNIVQRAESGGWLLSRDLRAVSLGELHEGLRLRVPSLDASLPGYDDPMGRAAARALDHLRQPLQAPLLRSVGSFLNPDEETK